MPHKSFNTVWCPFRIYFRVKQCTDENRELLKRLKVLQSQNESLTGQLHRLRSLLSRNSSKAVQPATCMMVLLLSLALVMVPNLRPNTSLEEQELSAANTALSQTSEGAKLAALPGEIYFNTECILSLLKMGFSTWSNWAFDISLGIGDPPSRRLTHNRPKYLEWNYLKRSLKIFPTKVRNFKLWKMAKLLNFRFPEGRYFLNCDDTELKRSSKINFSVSERHRWAVVGSPITAQSIWSEIQLTRNWKDFFH